MGYNKHYLEEDYFGEPYPELVDFFKENSAGRVLDLGAGQGRDSLMLATLGYEVTAVDQSIVGLNQLLAKNDTINTHLGDINSVKYNGYDYILLDSMIHLYKSDFEKEKNLLEKIHTDRDLDSKLIIVVQDGKRVEQIKAFELGHLMYEKTFMYQKFQSMFTMLVFNK